MEALLRVLEDYPWLAETLANADWWVLEDGHVVFNARIEDGEDRRAGFEAFTRALGMDLREEPLSDAPPTDLPSHAPMRLSELRQGLRSRRHSPRPASEF
jgi:hypothetical protein